MIMEDTVKGRLLAFIESKGISKNKFEQMCGLSHRYVSNISKSIQPDVVKKISLIFPELNMGWLLSGSGEMTCQDPSTSPEDIPLVLTGDAKALVLNLSETLKQQESNIAKLTEMVDRLTGSVEVKRGIA